MKYTSTWMSDYVLDINECQGDHGCDQECVNEVGGFHCECRTGYQLVDTFSCGGQLIVPHSIIIRVYDCTHIVQFASILAGLFLMFIQYNSHDHCHDNILHTY